MYRLALQNPLGGKSESSELRKLTLRHCLRFFLSFSLHREDRSYMFYRRWQIGNLHFSTVSLKAENLCLGIRHWEIAAGATLTRIGSSFLHMVDFWVRVQWGRWEANGVVGEGCVWLAEPAKVDQISGCWAHLTYWKAAFGSH